MGCLFEKDSHGKLNLTLEQVKLVIFMQKESYMCDSRSIVHLTYLHTLFVAFAR